MLLYVFASPGDERVVLGLMRDPFRDAPLVAAFTMTAGLLTAYGPGGRIWRTPFRAGQRPWPEHGAEVPQHGAA